MRVGVQVQPQHADFEGMRRAWREADELGVDSIFTWDHFYPLYGDADGTHFEGITDARGPGRARPSARRSAALVFCNSYRNPELLADAHRTIDHISGGRAILGIGAGWFERDYDEYGYEFGTAPDRLRELRAATAADRRRGSASSTRRRSGKLPILIGGSGPKVTLKLVARYADMWHSLRRRRGVQDQERDPARALRGPRPRPVRDRAHLGRAGRRDWRTPTRSPTPASST